MDKKISVLHINNNYMGSSLHQKLIRSLNDLHIFNIVFAPLYIGEKRTVIPDNYVITKECYKKNDRFFYVLKQNKILKCLYHNIDTKKFSCIHAYTLFTDGFCAMRVAQKEEIPFYVAVRYTDVDYFFKWRILLRPIGILILKRARRIFFLSEQYKDKIINNYIPSKLKNEILSKSHVIPNGIDNFWLENQPKNGRQLNNIRCIKLLFVGKIGKRKNPIMTAKAVEILLNKGYSVTFTMVGQIEDKNIYEKLKYMHFVHYLSPRPKENLIDLYRSNDIFVMPSISETFGLTYAEAMSQGVPVIYTKGQGFDGQFEEGKVGYHVLPDSPNDIAKKIEMIINNYNTLSNNCLELVKKFDWIKIANEYEKFYIEDTKNNINVN